MLDVKKQRLNVAREEVKIQLTGMYMMLKIRVTVNDLDQRNNTRQRKTKMSE